MSRMIFLNLPVADIAVSRRFYEALGFTYNATFSDADTASFVVNDNVVIMALSRPKFSGFLAEGQRIADADTKQALFALSADSREEVDQVRERALAAGGSFWEDSQDHGFMYGGSFRDPDGHAFELVWMDPSAVTDGPPDMA